MDPIVLAWRALESAPVGLGARLPPGPEALTDRELAVLAYLPTRLTTAEIAAELFVSTNTVKTHLRGIYRKVDARSRAEAVARARTLGLLR